MTTGSCSGRWCRPGVPEAVEDRHVTTGLPPFATARNHEEKIMKIADGAVLVTGANRGVGQALVEGASSARLA
jgi:hypothetical protein